jgi:hypothetical protein
MGRKLKVERELVGTPPEVEALRELEKEWSTPETMTASAILEDVVKQADEKEIVDRLAKQVESVINSEDVPENKVQSLRDLLNRWRTG